MMRRVSTSPLTRFTVGHSLGSWPPDLSLPDITVIPGFGRLFSEKRCYSRVGLFPVYTWFYRVSCFILTRFLTFLILTVIPSSDRSGSLTGGNPPF